MTRHIHDQLEGFSALRASQIEQELRDDDLPRRASKSLMRAADRNRRAMVRVLQEFGLTLPQYNVMTILLHNDELPTHGVAARLVEETPGITRLMNTLIAKKYIRRRSSTDDRRQQLCSLTNAGRRVVEAAIPRFSEMQASVISDLSEKETSQLVALLRRVAP